MNDFLVFAACSIVLAYIVIPRYVWRGKVWTTREGKQIPIRNLDDDHLRSILRMLDISHARRCVNVMFDDGKGNYDDPFDTAAVQTSVPRHPLYADLLAEARRRGIKW